MRTGYRHLGRVKSKFPAKDLSEQLKGPVYKVLAGKIKAFSPQVILTSDPLRAKETAEIVNRNLALPLFESVRLRECRLGDPEGWLRDDLIKFYGEESWQRWLSVKKEDANFGFPNGENKIEHLQRMQDHLQEFFAAHSHYVKIAVSTHGGSLRRLVHHCAGAPEEPVPMPNCALYKIYFDSGSGLWSYGEAIE